MKFLLDGLLIFEALGIVKHEKRRILLGKVKQCIVERDVVKIKDMMSIIELYPNRITTSAYENLVELAVQKIIKYRMLIKMDV